MSEPMEEPGDEAPEVEVTISLLPTEILELIIGNAGLSYRDVCCLSSVSKRLNGVCCPQNRELWRKKFAQKWPHLVKLVYQRMDADKVAEICWKSETKARLVYGVDTQRQVKQLLSSHYNEGEMSEDAFHGLVAFDVAYGHPLGCTFQMDQMEMILNDKKPHENLTDKYYGEKGLRFLRHSFLKTQWVEYFEELQLTPTLIERQDDAGAEAQKGEEEEENTTEMAPQDIPGDLIHGAALIASWCQTNKFVDEVEIRRNIELIAQLTVDEVRAYHPLNELITKRRGECLVDSDALVLKDSLYPVIDCKHVLLCVNSVLFVQLGFTGNRADYYETHNSCIDQVIKRRTGIPITLCLLYQAIAAKLGVKTYPVNFPGHFLLKWRQFPDLKLPREQFSYIDVFQEGRFINEQQVHSFLPEMISHPVSDAEFDSQFSVAKPISVFRRMCNNLVEVGRQQEISNDGLLNLRNGLELMTIIASDDIEPRLLLSRVYIHLNINLEQVQVMLKEINKKDPSSTGIVMFLNSSVQSQLVTKARALKKGTPPPKTRCLHPKVKFAVGMIMRHKKYNYTCVVYGWDPKCAASRDWIYQMGVNSLPNKDQQPFYNVLVDDGSSRYAAQENLEVEKEGQPIGHPEIGRYFETFCRNHYFANEEKAKEYPEDEEVRVNWMQHPMK